MTNAKLAITDRLHDQLFEHLFPGDLLEAAAVLLCNHGKGKDYHRLIAVDLLKASYDRSEREKDFVSWPFADCFSPDRVTQIDQAGQSILTVHSHPKNASDFSVLDDQTDKELFPSICNWFDDERPHGSAIMLPDGRIHARIVDRFGEFHNMDTVYSVGDAIRMWNRSKIQNESEYGKKLAQTFGTGTLDVLRALRVGVIGCSGTGSVIIELLARNCVGELVIVDPDIVEEKNLNRMVGGTINDVHQSRSKVQVMEHTVREMGLGTTVYPYQDTTSSPAVVAALVDCDVLFGCVDSASGRYHLDCIASAYFIPYFDIGVHLEADGTGNITAADAVSHYVQPYGQSLLQRHAYTTAQVTAENWLSVDPNYYQRQNKAGYLATVGEEQPAVMSINMQAACQAFNDFLARIHQFRLDDNREFATQRFRLVHGCFENEVDLEVSHSLMAKYAGKGDLSLLVQNNMTHHAKTYHDDNPA